LLNAFSSPDPTPGGGSAAALSGAIAASLLAMVAGMAKTRNGLPAEHETLGACRHTLVDLRQTLVDLIDRDAAAYDAVVAAYRLPKATDAEKAARRAAIQGAMRVATDVPLETMRACRKLLDVAETVGACGNPNAASDVGVAVELARAGLSGAHLNVGINLDGLGDAGAASAIAAEAARLARA
jgi:formiminotetrahydrofolate cyclodeaminase